MARTAACVGQAWSSSAHCTEPGWLWTCYRLTTAVTFLGDCMKLVEWGRAKH